MQSNRRLILLAATSLLIPGNLAFSQNIYYADGFGAASEIRRADLDGSNDTVILSGGITSADGVEVDLAGGKIYWIQQNGQLRRANLDGTGAEILVNTGGTPHSIALDTTNGKVYWSETSANRIRRANLDGTSVEIVVNSAGTDGLTLDVANEKVYWTQGSQIRRANLDGSNNELVFTRSGPHGLELDGTGLLYWTDLSTGRVERGNADGSGSVDILVTGQSTPVEIDIDAAAGKMYWTELSGDRVRRADLDGANLEVLLSGLSGPFGIDVAIPGPQIPTVSAWGFVVMLLLLTSAGSAAFLRFHQRAA